ncbi:hypothetical protein [Enterococcus sp. AZ126]|uniref:hypothetical protein n=1 Tax=Enterococcus sp. AZ126 TaxID=2774635 RepID=UPI003F20279B
MNKKWSSFIGVGFVIGLSLLAATGVQAEEVSPAEKSTPIQITIAEKTLALTNVTIPTFSTREVTESEQVIHPTNDWVIGVKDQRSNARSPWELRVQLSLLTSEKAALPDQRITLDKGQLQSEKTTLDSSGYNAKKAVLQTTSQTVVHVEDTTHTTYEYRIPKEKVSLVIPKTATAGTYKAIQQVQLTALPEIP